jgi:hypothetical protein
MFRTCVVSICGLVGNALNVGFLVTKRDKIDFTESFTNLLILLSVFDIFFLLNCIGTFGLPAVSTSYSTNVYPHALPFL